MAAAAYPPVAKIAISGSVLAAILQRSSSAAGDIDGLLFGHVTHLPSSDLTDDDHTSTTADPKLVATVTSYVSFNSVCSFYDPLGRIHVSALVRSHPASLFGWFVSRRRTALRPSMRETAVSASLAKFLFKDSNLGKTLSPNPQALIFLLISTPLSSNDSLIHTHEYRAFQFRVPGPALEPKSVDVINIGPAFRGNYSAFSPISPMPWLPFGSGGVEEETRRDSLDRLKRASKEQRVLDLCAEGFDVRRLERMVGPETTNYASQIEDLYRKMMAKLEELARLVEKSSAQVLEQENKIMKLRNKFAGMD